MNLSREKSKMYFDNALINELYKKDSTEFWNYYIKTWHQKVLKLNAQQIKAFEKSLEGGAGDFVYKNKVTALDRQVGGIMDFMRDVLVTFDMMLKPNAAIKDATQFLYQIYAECNLDIEITESTFKDIKEEYAQR